MAIKAVRRTRSAHPRMRGAVTIEFSLIMMFGLLPLLMLLVTGALIFAVRQSITQAAAEGARAALQYGADGTLATRRINACHTASGAMQWLLDFSGQAAACTAPDSGPITVRQVPCADASDSQVACMQVVVSYDYDAHPLMPGTGGLYGWVMGRPLSTSATVQINQG